MRKIRYILLFMIVMVLFAEPVKCQAKTNYGWIIYEHRSVLIQTSGVNTTINLVYVNKNFPNEKLTIKTLLNYLVTGNAKNTPDKL